MARREIQPAEVGAAPASHVDETTGAHGGIAPQISPFTNIMADSGRFAGKINPQALTTTAAFTASGFFNPYNSASAFVSAGKFIHNNTTNGGTAGDLTQDVQDLIAAMGRSGGAARYGVEFYVAETTAGTGTTAPYTASDAVERYLLTTNGARAIFGLGTFASCGLWVRIKSGGSLAVRRMDELRRGGADQASDVILTPADGWAHVLSHRSTSLGYDTSFPYLYASASGDVVQIACPAFFPGRAYPGVHTAPLPTINELIVV